MTSPRLRLLATGAFLLATLAPPHARANGRFPAANHLVQRAGDPTRLALRTTFGVLVTSDGGQHWDWVCERAMGYAGAQDPPISYTQGGSLVAALFEGLAVSPADGCGFGFIGGPLAKEVMIDVTLRPDDGRTVLAITGTYVGSPDGGEAYRTQVYGSHDDGATWSKVGAPLDPTIIVESVEVAKSDPARIYVSAVRGQGAATTGAIFVSKDTGATWKEFPVPIDATSERASYIGAVDPTNADRVYLRTDGTSSGRLLVTDDGGQTFRAVYKGGPLLGFDVSPDGSTVYLGGDKDGLLVATSAALQFKKRASLAVECLRRTETKLYACSNEASGFILGESTDEGATWKPLLHLSTIRGPLACPSTATGNALCVADFPALAEQLGIGDGGVGGDGGDGGGSAPPPKAKSGGCSFGMPAGVGGFGGAAALLAGVVARRRRRRGGRGGTAGLSRPHSPS